MYIASGQINQDTVSFHIPLRISLVGQMIVCLRVCTETLSAVIKSVMGLYGSPWATGSIHFVSAVKTSLTTDTGRIARRGRDKKPILSENPRNRPTKQSARSSPPGKNPISKSKSQYRVAPAKKNTSEHPFSINDAGFVQFLKNHTSPKHQRVTAGGRIVPMEPPKAPHLEGSSPAMMVAVNGFESIAGQIFIDGQAMVMNIARTTDSQEKVSLIRASTGDSTSEQLSSAVFTSGFSQQTERGSQDAAAFQDMGPEPSFIAYIQDPTEGIHDNSVSLWTFPEWHEIDPPAPDDRWGRWNSISSEIGHDEAAIRNMWLHVEHLDNFPTLDFYSRFARCVWCWGLDAVEQAEHWLRNKLHNHERYLAEVNEVIAMDPRNGPNITLFALRVYNINERAKLLAAIEILEVFTERRHHEHFEPMVNGVSDGDKPIIFIEPTGSNRGIDIIDPETGRPIVIQVPEASTNHTNGNDHGSRDSAEREAEAELSSNLLTFDGANESIGKLREGNSALRSGNAASRSTSQNSQNAQGAQNTPGDATPASESNGNISWVHQETWIEPLPSQNGNRVSETVPRNFGGSPHRHRLALPSFSEFDQEKYALEEASTTGTAGSPSPPLSPVISV